MNAASQLLSLVRHTVSESPSSLLFRAQGTKPMLPLATDTPVCLTEARIEKSENPIPDCIFLPA